MEFGPLVSTKNKQAQILSIFLNLTAEIKSRRIELQISSISHIRLFLRTSHWVKTNQMEIRPLVNTKIKQAQVSLTIF